MAAKEKKSAVKKFKGKLPSKQTLNLVYKEKDTGRRIFVILAIITLIVYNVLPSVKNEEDFQ